MYQFALANKVGHQWLISLLWRLGLTWWILTIDQNKTIVLHKSQLWTPPPPPSQRFPYLDLELCMSHIISVKVMGHWRLSTLSCFFFTLNLSIKCSKTFIFYLGCTFPLYSLPTITSIIVINFLFSSCP